MSDIGNKEIFARNLSRYVERSGKQQKELAEIVGVSTSTFNDWMKGKKYPRIGKIEKLAGYFGILKSDLIEDKSKVDKEETGASRNEMHRIADLFGVTYEELMAFNSDEKRQQLVDLAMTVPEDKLALILRLAKSVLEDA